MMVRITAGRARRLPHVAGCILLLAAAGSALAQQPAATHGNTYSTRPLFATQPPRVSPEVHPDGRITFQFTAPNASRVDLLFGEWNVKPLPMAKDDKGLWTLTIGPVEPEIYNYLFSIDGVQALDFANPQVKTAR